MAGASAAAVYEEGLTEAIHDDEAILTIDNCGIIKVWMGDGRSTR